MQTLYILLENGPKLGPSLLYPIPLNVAIQWWVQPYAAHVIAVQLNMADWVWILLKWEENQSIFFVVSYQVSLCCYSGHLTFLL